ncbi:MULTISPECIES: ImmA/IrrE family metallo-endopeptidase [unclassified Phaeobacter]|uniref:ImmA/IrrE family metallo-endopeptidase n=1 Tax=unclassified Phaeobacter TaxID=2621772 RepID=UPI003A883817
MANEGPRVDQYSAADIHETVRRVLRDLGNPEPPLDLKAVRELQKLDLTYYSKADLNLLDEMAHQVRLGKHNILSTAKRMKEVVSKAGLKALIVPDQRHIYIDEEVVDKKKRFIEAHEITHDLLDWHRDILLGDNDETLSVHCHEEMEAEANYGARQLIFMGERFTVEVRDSLPDWRKLQALAKLYGNSLTTTLWQTVYSCDPAAPMFGAIGQHPYYPNIGGRDGNQGIAYFIRSDAFFENFPEVSERDIFGAMFSYVSRSKRGPLGDGISTFRDANGELCEFHMQSFSNTYDVLTMGRFVKRHQKVIGF